ncbi:hypothetical protein [Rubritalea sp.]
MLALYRAVVLLKGFCILQNDQGRQRLSADLSQPVRMGRPVKAQCVALG